MYDGYGEKLAAALLMRPCRGYHVPVMKVVPPGLEFSNLKVRGVHPGGNSQEKSYPWAVGCTAHLLTGIMLCDIIRLPRPSLHLPRPPLFLHPGEAASGPLGGAAGQSRWPVPIYQPAPLAQVAVHVTWR